MDRIRSSLLPIWLAAATWPAASALASEPGTVTALQPPAWLYRQQVLNPLRPGLQLQGGDEIRTGDGARVEIRLAGGGRLRLGTRTTLILRSASAALTGPRSVFEITLKAGTLRLNSSAAGPEPREYLLYTADLRLRTAEADLVLRQHNGESTLCLIEGKTGLENTLTKQDLTLATPLTLFRQPRLRPPLPARPATSRELAELVAATELRPGRGILTADGRWAAHVLSARYLKEITEEQQLLWNQGYPVAKNRLYLKTGTWYRLSVNHFLSRADAQAFTERIRALPFVQAPWVSKMQE